MTTPIKIPYLEWYNVIASWVDKIDTPLKEVTRLDVADLNIAIATALKDANDWQDIKWNERGY